ncbi:MAG: hypothetical protein JWM28_2909 [Chitinophagaceae bacterium]|nr:hypothetical protein [Chitinophagaceae bacterium]
MLFGSMAMSTYTLPRFTRDFDFIVHLKPEDASLLATAFNEGYYCNEDSIREAIRNKSMFNIIDHKSNYKADFVILKNEPYRKMEFERRQQINFLGLKVYIVAPEDLLLSKLIWIQELQSSLQMEDIKLLQEVKGLDLHYIRQWIDTLKLNTFDLINK